MRLQSLKYQTEGCDLISITKRIAPIYFELLLRNRTFTSLQAAIIHNIYHFIHVVYFLFDMIDFNRTYDFISRF